ncbi:MAG TPA: thioredoxin family protein, partial [Puia sp.]|nr:thioredoxin family protein [Puia sp.]
STMIQTFFLSLLLMTQGSSWLNNMQEAKALAQREHRHILLNFSGSDWCGPCILLRKEVFDDPVFLAMADSQLVLVNADFPRMKKNQLPKAQQQANDQLADRYNAQGKFPLTLLLTVDGKVLRQWEGNPGLKPADFSSQVAALIATDNGH